MGSVLITSASNFGKVIISIENVNITTIQTIEEYLENKKALGKETDDYYSLFIFDSDGDIINMDRINIQYLYGHTIYSIVMTISDHQYMLLIMGGFRTVN